MTSKRTNTQANKKQAGKKRQIVTSQIFNLECYALDHHCISYFIAFWLDPGESWGFRYFHI